MKLLSTIVLFAALIFTAPSVNAAAFPYITLNAKTNRVSDNGTSLTYNGSALGGSSGNWTASGTTNSLLSGVASANYFVSTNGYFLDASQTNTTFGYQAGLSNLVGQQNTVFGYKALNANTNGSRNTAIGYFALGAHQTSDNNVAIGDNALAADIGGSVNTAIGHDALHSSTTAIENTAVGYNALGSTTSGGFNAAFGVEPMKSNISGSNNVVMGFEAMYGSTNAHYNVVIGPTAAHTTLGDNNVILGRSAAFDGTTATLNVIAGSLAAQHMTTGARNAIIGRASSFNIAGGSDNVTIGEQSLEFNTNSTGRNVVIGSSSSINSTNVTGVVTIGYKTGQDNQRSNTLMIHNAASAVPLVYGEFDTPLLTVNGALTVAGSMSHSIASGSAVTLSTNEVYLVTTDAQLITLPTAVGRTGRTYTIKTVAPASTATVTNAAGIKIDGANSYSLSASNKFVSVISDNVSWWIIGNN